MHCRIRILTPLALALATLPVLASPGTEAGFNDRPRVLGPIVALATVAPDDVMLVSAASPSVPPALGDQLAEGGRCLVPVGSRESQELRLLRKVDGEIVEEVVRDACTFVPLLGQQGWTDPSGPGAS
jgi:hypothetical protein